MSPGVDVALQAECLVSAVGLMYSAVDALAALARPEGQPSTTRADFIGWSEKYLLPSESLGCRTIDIYGARCGVLHTFSPESDLERAGEARRIIYQWRAGPAADVAVPLPVGAIVIDVEALATAVRRGVERFLLDVESDPALRSRIQHHLPSLLCYCPWPQLEAIITV